MTGSGRVRCTGLLLAGLLMHAGVAAAAGLSTESQTPTGSFTYTWQGDPARGCAGAGVCGIRGELVLRPLGATNSFSFGGGGTIVPLDTSGTVRVRRDTAGSQPAECVDVADESLGGFSLQIVRRQGSLVAAAQVAAPSGVCAGPLSTDLARATLPVKRSGGKRPTFDLRGTRAFTAGPFSGMLVSSLVLRPAQTGGGSGYSFTGSFGSAPSSPRRTWLEHVELQYSISPVPSTLQTQFAGASSPDCEIADSCGARGLLALSVRPPGALLLYATRVVKRRETAARALSDFRRGELSVGGFDAVSGTVSETFSRADGSGCQDAAPANNLGLSFGSLGPFGTGGRHVPVTLSYQGPPGADTLRTHCPGPGDAEIIGQNGNIASASVTTAQLLAPRLVISLSRPGGFAGFGYQGSRQGAVELGLTLTQAKAGTTSESG